MVCDRSVPDNYAYMVHAVGRRPDLEPLLRHWLSTYKLLVRVPCSAWPSTGRATPRPASRWHRRP
ncbi:MAG: hypothetical protein IPH09_11485 [bacterium]|nr:hypothetical protein [bacterium]